MKRFIIFPIALVYVLMLIRSNAWAASVTVNTTQKTALSDTTDLSIKGTRIEDSQVGLLINSTLTEPQDFTLKIPGLKEDYDIYVCGSYIGQRSAKQLADGIELNIPGRVTHPDLMRCLYALKDKIKPQIDSLSKVNESEPIRVVWTLRQADGWVRSGIGSDESYRSLDVTLNPAGRMLKKWQWRTRQDAKGTVTAATNACWYLQKARARMYEAIKDPDLRNRAVVTMTPVTFTTNYIAAKKQITAKLVNDCNLPISGTITYALPKGWKVDAKSLEFKNLGAGKTYQTSLNLIAPSNTTNITSEIAVAANVMVIQDKYTAKFKLRNIIETSVK
ncbi:NEW3 domain-containing protein [bacterium]|nr:NEW3 domain-containing protein [bacterium]